MNGNKIGGLKTELQRLASDYAIKPSRRLIEEFRDKRIEMDLGVAEIGQRAYDEVIAEFEKAAGRLPQIEARKSEIAAELAKIDVELAEAQKRLDEATRRAQALHGESWGLRHEADRLQMVATQAGADLADPESWKPVAAAARREAIARTASDLEIKNILLV